MARSALALPRGSALSTAGDRAFTATVDKTGCIQDTPTSWSMTSNSRAHEWCSRTQERIRVDVSAESPRDCEARSQRAHLMLYIMLYEALCEGLVLRAYVFVPSRGISREKAIVAKGLPSESATLLTQRTATSPTEGLPAHELQRHACFCN